jgi:hypothetical protein
MLDQEKGDANISVHSRFLYAFFFFFILSFKTLHPSKRLASPERAATKKENLECTSASTIQRVVSNAFGYTFMLLFIG